MENEELLLRINLLLVRHCVVSLIENLAIGVSSTDTLLLAVSAQPVVAVAMS